ncbi:MAG: TRAP transporter small permease [Phycisphaerales bacterium]|nr:MAG: TRAP transporter small permease [Phycisphaerales bacterium]
MNNRSETLNRLLDYLIFLILLVMATIMALNVFCRFVLLFSLSWVDEVAQILLVWLTFLGAAIGIRERAHYTFEYLAGRLSGRLRRYLLLLSHTLTTMAIGLLLYWSSQVAWGIRHWIMPATEISRAWVYGACPVGALLMLIYSIDNTMTIWYGDKTK